MQGVELGADNVTTPQLKEVQGAELDATPAAAEVSAGQG